MKFTWILLISFMFVIIDSTTAWDHEELEIFDLVEEINLNFYNVLGIQQNATLQEIKRAFRNLSIVLHPDKSDAEDANIQFRNLVSIYEVLKDQSKREKYDTVLKNGLPNWKSALYYYRHVRKMGLVEMGIILFFILTIGQYIISWAAYIEKKYTAESILGSKLKKLQKKNKTNMQMDTILNNIPTPSIFNTLPFQIPKTIWGIPSYIKGLIDSYKVYKQEQLIEIEREAKELERQLILEEAIQREKEAKKEGLRKRKEKYAAKEKTDEELKGFSSLSTKHESDGISMRAVNAKENVSSGGLWTDDDLSELIRLVKKYPGGTSARWEIIAEFLNRSVTEITFMAAKLKENGYRIPGQQPESVAEQIVLETVKKVKVKRVDNSAANAMSAAEINWSQEQQQLLEAAIVKCPKSGATDRWQKIANNVPGKTKEECLARYKYLVEIVKSQKAKAESNKMENNNNNNNNDDDNKNDIEEKQNDTNIDMDDMELNELTENQLDEPVKGKGKPKNKRKERKKKMDFSSDEDDEDE